MRPHIHANTIYICSTIADPRTHQQLCIKEDNIFCYDKYYLLLWYAAYKVGVNHCDIELLCYVWHAIAGPIWHYISNPPLEFWFPETVYTTASNFIQNHEPNLHMNDQTTLIPWV